jgi:serine/threonine-protein kinase
VIVTGVDPLIGATIGGHYEIEALIGVGAMGRVYRAHHTRLGNKRYALKVLFGELTASPTMRMRFAHEAESASKLDHPNIVGVLDFGCTESGLMYLVMDLVEGPTLGGLIDQGAMSSSRVVAIARQLCAGLAHAHARGIVHRDFKPDNILVSSSGSELLRIADFGLAISLSEEDGDARLTGTGILCTPTYAAPEQLLAKDIDHRADLYALGVTLYEMLTGGVLPFARGSQEVMLWKVTTEWPAVSARAPKASPALADLIRRLLAREPSARPASAQAVIDALDKITVSAAHTAVASPVRWPLRLPLRWSVSIAAGLALVGGIALAARLLHTGPTAPLEGAILAPGDSSEEPVAGRVAPSVTHEIAVPAPPPDQDAPGPDPEPSPLRRRVATSRPAITPPSTRPQEKTRSDVGVSGRAPAATETLRSDPSLSVRPPTAAMPPMEPAPAPVTVAQPHEPTPPIVAKVTPPPPIQTVRVPAAPVTSAAARPPRILALEIAGALAPSVVRRALDRVMPALQACTDKVGTRVVAVRFAIEETRRAVNVQLGGAGAACIAATLGSMRTDTAPDVGEVSVTVRLAFGSGS